MTREEIVLKKIKVNLYNDNINKDEYIHLMKCISSQEDGISLIYKILEIIELLTLGVTINEIETLLKEDSLYFTQFLITYINKIMLEPVIENKKIKR